MFFKFLKNFCFKFMDLYEPDSLLRHWNGFEDFNILNIKKMLLKIPIVFKIFVYCPFLSLTTITGQQNLLSFGDRFSDRIFGTKNGFELFWLRSWKPSFGFAFLYDLFTNKARKIEVAGPNPIMENNFSLSVSVGNCLSFFSFTFYLSLSLLLALFVDAALQLLLCGVLSASLEEIIVKSNL